MEETKKECRCNEQGRCCYCGTTLRYYAHIPCKELDGHIYCVNCYPQACTVWVAEQKVKTVKEEKCEHDWYIDYTDSYGIKILRCKKCGDTKEYKELYPKAIQEKQKNPKSCLECGMIHTPVCKSSKGSLAERLQEVDYLIPQHIIKDLADEARKWAVEVALNADGYMVDAGCRYIDWDKLIERLKGKDT